MKQCSAHMAIHQFKPVEQIRQYVGAKEWSYCPTVYIKYECSKISFLVFLNSVFLGGGN